jgi:hypothetical protein
MDYVRITNINDPLFAAMHKMMGEVFPPEEVLAFELWKEPLEDPGIRVFVAVQEGEVVGATEYRVYPDYRVAMTDFTIIGRPGLGVGPFLHRSRMKDIAAVARGAGVELLGMFAEIYDPYRARHHAFGGVKPMDPYVRREVLSHLGYRRLDFPYVHPSWQGDGEAVGELDLCFLPFDDGRSDVPAALVTGFLRRYYSVLPNKPEAWNRMVAELDTRDSVRLQPI